MKLKKIFSLLVFLLALVGVAFPVQADSSSYEISSVYVNGIQAEGNLVQVELGSTAQVQVYLEGTGESTDVRVTTWIGGYEYGSVQEYTDVFYVEDGVSYKKTLYIEIPEDLDVSSNEYTLHVEIYDSEEREEKTYTLYFEQERHDVIVEDVLLSANTVAPGDYLGVKVRVENQGEKDEEDLKVTVSIPELGVSNRVYMDELVSGDQDNAPTAYLVIPRDASGDYAVRVTVAYNNGYSEVTETTYITVEGELMYDENTFVSVSSLTDLTVGEKSSYKVQVTNLGGSAKTFYLTVDGFDAAYDSQITVPAHSSGEFTFTLYPEEAGTEHVFVEVRTDEGLVTQKLFTVDVGEKSNGLVIVFSVFFIVLVIMGTILFMRKK